MEVKNHSFFKTAHMETSVLLQVTAALPGEIAAGTNSIRDRVDPRAGVDAAEKEKVPLFRGIEPLLFSL
jgi:hypothetical protein